MCGFGVGQCVDFVGEFFQPGEQVLQDLVFVDVAAAVELVVAGLLAGVGDSAGGYVPAAVGLAAAGAAVEHAGEQVLGVFGAGAFHAVSAPGLVFVPGVVTDDRFVGALVGLAGVAEASGGERVIQGTHDGVG